MIAWDRPSLNIQTRNKQRSSGWRLTELFRAHEFPRSLPVSCGNVDAVIQVGWYGVLAAKALPELHQRAQRRSMACPITPDDAFVLRMQRQQCSAVGYFTCSNQFPLLVRNVHDKLLRYSRSVSDWISR